MSRCAHTHASRRDAKRETYVKREGERNLLQTITADRVTSAGQEGSIRFSQLTTSTPPGHGRLMWVVAGRHTHARARVLTSSLKYSPIFCERDTCPPRRKKAGFPRHLITNQIITRLTTFFPLFLNKFPTAVEFMYSSVLN